MILLLFLKEAVVLDVIQILCAAITAKNVIMALLVVVILQLKAVLEETIIAVMLLRKIQAAVLDLQV